MKKAFTKIGLVFTLIVLSIMALLILPNMENSKSAQVVNKSK
ncbi:type II secretion system protein [Sulfurimonas sp.]|nr:type II secretion system protein [Sulfurimonas sp.]